MYGGDSKVENISLVVAAAGVGKRMGLGYPKQFLEYEGKPLFIHSLQVAQETSSVKEIVVVTGKENIDIVKEHCKNFEIHKVVAVVAGGAERQNSVHSALKYCDSKNVIAVQDGVRPFLKARYFKEALDILNSDTSLAGVVVGVPVKDTIKIIDSSGQIVDTPVRSHLVAAQTPQIFRGEILKKAYEDAENNGFLGTDDSSLVERIQGKIKILLGDYDNIKITTQEDLKFLK